MGSYPRMEKSSCTGTLYLEVQFHLWVYNYIYIYIHIRVLNFTKSWGFGIFRVYWVSKSKCIISSNLRAEGSSGKVLNVVIFVESVVHRSNWRSRETETVGNSRKQSGAARRDHAKIVNPQFFCKKKHFDFETQYTLKIPKPQDLVKFNTSG